MNLPKIGQPFTKIPRHQQITSNEGCPILGRLMLGGRMKRSWTVSIFVGLILSVDWMTISYKPSLAVENPKNCVHVGRIISVQGQVQLRRKHWSDYHPTAVGAELCDGDVLLPRRRATVIVQCADPSQNLWTVPDTQPSGAAKGCPDPKEKIHTITKPINSTREQFAGRIPYIVSPKKTWLLNNKPKLRWMAVPSASSYVVRVSGPWVNWTTEVKTSSVVYPGEPPLKPGEGYLLRVEADNGESSPPGLFGLLDESKATRVRAAAKRIARQNLTSDAKTLALAELYIGQGLIAEATDLMEAAVALGSKTAAIHYLRGELYVQVQLLSQAEASYLKAVDLATTARDIEGQALASARLGEIYKARGNFNAAAYWLKQAQQGLKTLLPLKPITH